MKHLHHFLQPESINLSLVADEEQEVFQEVIALLKEDSRVADWNEFFQAIIARSAYPVLASNKKAIVIYHGRTNAVHDLIMAIGRSKKGIIFKECEHPIHLVFIMGVPNTLNNEYLRIMGAIARACQNSTKLEELLATENSNQFIALLSEECGC